MVYRFCRICDIPAHRFENARNMLPESQLKYILQKPEKRAEQSLAARILLCDLLEKEYGFSDGFSFGFLPDGRPFLTEHPELFISLSHSGGYAACCVSSHPVGIDVERVRSVSERLIGRVCTPEEREFERLNGNDSFFRIWTLKEAFFKMSELSFTETLKTSFVKDGVFPFFEDANIHFISELSDGCALSVLERL